MVTWNNLDTLASFKELSKMERVNLVEAMSGENGADRVKKDRKSTRLNSSHDRQSRMPSSA